MTTTTTTILASVVGLALAGAASGIDAFTETFPTGDADWRGFTNAEILDYTPTGGVGVEQDGFVSETFNFVATQPGAFGAQTLFRGEDATDASGDAFVGDWNNQTELNFWVRHDFDQPLTFFVRLAGPQNFPSINYQSPDAIAPDTWTQISAPLDDASQWVLTGTPFETVLSDIGNVQIGVDRLADTPLPGLDRDVVFDLDRVELIPSPGAIGLAAIAGLAGLRRRRRA
jgi:hypothetical protein